MQSFINNVAARWRYGSWLLRLCLICAGIWVIGALTIMIVMGGLYLLVVSFVFVCGAVGIISLMTPIVTEVSRSEELVTIVYKKGGEQVTQRVKPIRFFFTKRDGWVLTFESPEGGTGYADVNNFINLGPLPETEQTDIGK